MATETSDAARGREADEEFVPFFGQFFPEALTLGALLSLLALVVSLPYLAPTVAIEQFATGFFGFFTVQMSLILLWVLSASVVESKLVGRFLDGIAERLPTGSQSAVIYGTGFVALLFGWLNWALGLVGGVLIGYKLCQQAADKGVAVHYPAVLTAGLLSMVITTIGLSSPGGLMMADTTGKTNFLVDPEQQTLVVDFSAFLFSPTAIGASLLFLFTLPAVLVVLAPNEAAERHEVSEYTTLLEGSITEKLDHYSPPPEEERVIADKLEQSRIISGFTFLIGGVSLGAYFVGGGRLTLLWFLFGLMMLGIFIQMRPMAFVDKIRDATRWVNHLAIPFLMYAGVNALLASAGLYDTIGNAFTATGVPQIAGFLWAFVLGVLVPSAGSVWVIQAPALTATNVGIGPSLVTVMLGAGVSNIWLGFLFVGVLAPITGFDWREYARYAAVITVYASVVAVGLLVFL